MVNISYTPTSSDLLAYPADGTTDLYNLGDMSWLLSSNALVMIMTPGVGFFYSGLLRRKNALSMVWLGVVIYALVSVQWFFWGYSLAFAANGSKFIGTLSNFGFMGVLELPSAGSSRVPALSYAVYQNMFATITPVLAFGAAAERGRMGPVLICAFMWATLVYDPIACWTWAPNGWLFQLGSLDFAGGGPVHMTSGTCALAYSIWLGKRAGYATGKLSYRPHNVTHVILGTVLLWFGWFGFNGGSALSANLRAVQASMVTNLAASVGGLTWMALDWRLERKWSAVGFCSGAISGLIGITPASGYVGSPAAVAIGFVTAIACNFATKLKFIFHYDDALDIFATHGVGGIVGNLLTAIFADSRVAGFDGTTVIPGGWINHNYVQLGYQLASVCAIVGYTFVMSMIIFVIVDHIPGCALRASEEAEIVGMDAADHGEWAFDYAYWERDIENKEPGHGYAPSSSKAASIDEKKDGALSGPSDVRQVTPATGAEKHV